MADWGGAPSLNARNQVDGLGGRGVRDEGLAETAARQVGVIREDRKGPKMQM